jgi:uncharacterized protein (TIGR03067 family)
VADRPPPPDLFVPKADPAPQAAPPASDLDRLQGAWVLTQTDGNAPGPDEKPTTALEFLKDRILAGSGHGRVRLDETKSPRQITITVGDEDPPTGIYKLEGDRLTIATHNKNAKLVPAGFEPDKEAGITVTVYERPQPPTTPPAVAPKDSSKADPPPKAPARDLQKEIDQLREQLKRLETELKDRKPKDPAIPH